MDIFKYADKRLHSFFEELDEVFHLPERPSNLQKYDENYIFDIERSVKWNRDQVIYKNSEYEKTIKSLLSKKEEKIKFVIFEIADKMSYDEEMKSLDRETIEMALLSAVDLSYATYDMINYAASNLYFAVKLQEAKRN